MDVKFNGRFLASSHPTGTHRSALNILRALAVCRRDPDVISVVAPPSDKTFVDPPPGVAVKIVNLSKAWMWHIWEQLSMSIDSSTIFVHPINTSSMFSPNRSVVMLHDLNLIRYFYNFKVTYLIWNLFATIMAARNADHIVCFSNTVAGDIHSWLSIPRRMITVIPQGPGLPADVIRDSVAVPSEEPYFLCVGSLQPHKNLEGIIAAWEESGLGKCGFALKIVGKAQGIFRTDSSTHVERSDVQHTGYVSDGELANLYRGALGFIYPSWDEGFGLPVVEAFYLDCPVITSNRSCLPEIAGEAAILVDPGNIGEMACAMKLLAFSSDHRERLRKSGRKRANQFTWARAGERLTTVLKAFSESRVPII